MSDVCSRAPSIRWRAAGSAPGRYLGLTASILVSTGAPPLASPNRLEIKNRSGSRMDSMIRIDSACILLLLTCLGWHTHATAQDCTISIRASNSSPDQSVSIRTLEFGSQPPDRRMLAFYAPSTPDFSVASLAPLETIYQRIPEPEQVVMLPAATIPRTDVVEFFYGSVGSPGNGYLGDIRILGL